MSGDNEILSRNNDIVVLHVLDFRASIKIVTEIKGGFYNIFVYNV